MMTSPKPPIWAITNEYAAGLSPVHDHCRVGGHQMTDVLNLPLQDHELLAEIAMTSDLMIVAAESDGPIPQPAIDAVLLAHAS